jgi:ribosomal protein L44E
VIKDSGDRTEFETGAKRDMHAGKGRMDLLPWYGIMEVSKHCEEGALKYGEHNVDKGIPLHSLLDSAARHLAKYMVGMDDEDHLRAACWNLLWALNQRETHPELDDRFSTKCNLEFLEKHLVVKPLDIVRIKCLQCGDTHKVPKEIWNNAPHLHDSHMKLSYCPICKKQVAHGIVEEVNADE